MLGSTYINLSSDIFNLVTTSSSSNNHIYLDITDSISVRSVLEEYKPDVIINCSAYTNVDKAETNRDLAHSINVDGVKNLIKFSSTNTKIVHMV